MAAAGPLQRAYDRHVLPWLIAWAMRAPVARAERARMAPRAAGVVVEIGVGSGLNLALYGAAVRAVVGVDPSRHLLVMARDAAAGIALPVALLEGSAEALPVADGAADTAVSTWTLCSIADPRLALRELRRVLRPGGRLLFVEHGRAPDPAVRRWQERLTPVWSRIAGGCHVDRDIGGLIRDAGFALERLDAGYVRGPRAMSYFYRGEAVAAR